MGRGLSRGARAHLLRIVRDARIAEFEREYERLRQKWAEEATCEACGADLEWVECWSCGGVGGTEPGDLYEQDPLWYDEDDTETCDSCAALPEFSRFKARTRIESSATEDAGGDRK